MTQDEIRRRHAKIETKQWKWDLAERDLQKLCSHPDVTKKSCSNTGNYDPSADSYWYECKCPDCGKQWNEDQ